MNKFQWIFLSLSLADSLVKGFPEIRQLGREVVGNASQSGGQNYWNAANLALDGDASYSYCARPYTDNSQLSAWWMVDLGSEYAIYNVTVYSDDYNAGYLSLRVSSSPNVSEHSLTEECGKWYVSDGFDNGNETIVCDPVLFGRYVSIQKTSGTRLNQMVLCEVMIMGRELDTNCKNCLDDICLETTSCNQCSGFKPPECQEECEDSYYGENCEKKCNSRCMGNTCDKVSGYCECESGYYGDDCDQCSRGCEDMCNSRSGRCSCKDWWDGSKCTIEVDGYEIPQYRITFANDTDSSIMVMWRTIRNLPDIIKQYCWYELEYRLEGESEWTVVASLDHEPGDDDTQQYTLTGLHYNTVYDVRVGSVRSLRGRTETTGHTPVEQFSTRCREPEKPVNLKITHQEENNGIILSISWEAPDPRCSRISDNLIQYRSSSAYEHNWQSKDLVSVATSARLPGLDHGEYVVRLTVTNNEGLSSFDNKTYATIYTDCRQCYDYYCKSTAPCRYCMAGYKPPECRNDTNCENCDDANNCESTASCQTCKAGYKVPECREECDPGDYGPNCAQECSKGCGNTCDPVSGMCGCHRWWTGNQCSSEIRALQLPTGVPTPKSVTNSSVVIKWKKITAVPEDLRDYYQYTIEYKEETSSSWAEWQTRHTHDPSQSHYQEATLTGLMYNTVYDVRVKSFRVQGGDREETGVSQETRFKTDCATPSPPQKFLATSQDQDNKVVLNILWEHPEVVGCNSIVKYTILYRLKSAPSDSWTTGATLSASSTSHTLELDKGQYVVRIVVTNDGNHGNNSNYAETSYGTSGGKSSFPMWVIGVIIPCLVVIVLVVVVVFMLRRRKQMKQKNQSPQVEQSTGPHEEASYEDIKPESGYTELKKK